jgi:hypothetical protein
MKKQALPRAALAAACGLIALLALPAAAQAHHVDSTSYASCELVNGVPTVTFEVEFKGFGDGDKPVSGTVELDGTSYTFSELTWDGEDFTLLWTKATTGGPHTLVGDFTWATQGGNNGYTSTTVTCPAPQPAIELTKTGASFAYAGDTVTYSFAVRNTGDVTLSLEGIADDKCIDAPVRKPGETDTSFGPGDTFNFSCTYVVPAGVGSVLNTASVCGEYTPPYGPPAKVCDGDDHEFPVRSIAIAIDKNAVESTAVAGTTVHFTIAVTNTGNTSFVSYQLDDANCDEARTGGNAADPNLDPGETWTYACAMATQAGQTSADNAATATGTNSDGRSASATDSASIPLTQPTAGTAPTTTPNLSAGGTLPETSRSGRARLRGPSGCVKRAFRATVRGRSIASVAFYVDGKLVKRFSRRGSSFSIKVKPQRYGLGRHRIVARVRFSADSGTRARRLPLTFRRCARQVVEPRFTG